MMRRLGGAVALTLSFASAAFAQNPPAGAALDVSAAIAQAAANYPAIAEARARAAAATAGVDVAKTAYLPHLDLVWQENRATANNIFGLLLPQPVVPPISGPVLGTTDLGHSVWGSAGGVLLSWEPIDFGQRRASVDLARAQTRAAEAQATATLLSTQLAAADAFLTALAADAVRAAAAANVARLDVFARSVHALVDNQLRPGAEASRADAELAAARTQLARATEQQALSRATLAEAVGAAGTDVQVVADTLDRLPPAAADEPLTPETHPAAQAEKQAVAAVEAREDVISRSTYPHVTFQSALAGRGSGAILPQTSFEGSGLWLQVPNWAVALSVTVPALEVFGARARGHVEAANVQAEQARYRQTIDTLKTQASRARASLTAARAISDNAAVEMAAARETESRARVRYEAGLTTVTEVAEAQRLLAQAEADVAIARLGVWRALLADAGARGDIQPFLNAVQK